MSLELWVLFVVFCGLLVFLAASLVDGIRERDAITLDALAKAAEAVVEESE